MDAQVCHVRDVKNGTVSRFQQYVDTAKLQDTMGARFGAGVRDCGSAAVPMGPPPPRPWGPGSP